MSDQNVPPRCLVVTGDLMAWSRMAGVVRHAGLQPEQVRGVEGVAAAGAHVAAVIVELNDPHGGVLAVQAATQLVPRPLVCAVGPHVDGALLAAARAAGADEVLPHSAVGEPLAGHLRRTLPTTGSSPRK